MKHKITIQSLDFDNDGVFLSQEPPEIKESFLAIKEIMNKHSIEVTDIKSFSAYVIQFLFNAKNKIDNKPEESAKEELKSLKKLYTFFEDCSNDITLKSNSKAEKGIVDTSININLKDSLNFFKVCIQIRMNKFFNLYDESNIHKLLFLSEKEIEDKLPQINPDIIEVMDERYLLHKNQRLGLYARTIDWLVVDMFGKKQDLKKTDLYNFIWEILCAADLQKIDANKDKREIYTKIKNALKAYNDYVIKIGKDIFI